MFETQLENQTLLKLLLFPCPFDNVGTLGKILSWNHKVLEITIFTAVLLGKKKKYTKVTVFFLPIKGCSSLNLAPTHQNTKKIPKEWRTGTETKPLRFRSSVLCCPLFGPLCLAVFGSVGADASAPAGFLGCTATLLVQRVSPKAKQQPGALWQGSPGWNSSAWGSPGPAQDTLLPQLSQCCAEGSPALTSLPTLSRANFHFQPKSYPEQSCGWCGIKQHLKIHPVFSPYPGKVHKT